MDRPHQHTSVIVMALLGLIFGSYLTITGFSHQPSETGPSATNFTFIDNTSNDTGLDQQVQQTIQQLRAQHSGPADQVLAIREENAWSGGGGNINSIRYSIFLPSDNITFSATYVGMPSEPINGDTAEIKAIQHLLSNRSFSETVNREQDREHLGPRTVTVLQPDSTICLNRTAVDDTLQNTQTDRPALFHSC